VYLAGFSTNSNLKVLFWDSNSSNTIEIWLVYIKFDCQSWVLHHKFPLKSNSITPTPVVLLKIIEIKKLFAVE
jgi:hypothetical protein